MLGYNIKKEIFHDNRRFVLLDIPSDNKYMNNLLELDADGNVIWEIPLKPIQRYLENDYSVIVDFNVLDEATIEITTFDAWILEFDINKEEVLSSFFTK